MVQMTVVNTVEPLIRYGLDPQRALLQHFVSPKYPLFRVSTVIGLSAFVVDDLCAEVGLIEM